MTARIIDALNVKAVISEKYNSFFNKSNGVFERYGKTKNDNPDFCEFGAEILDIEISTICNGINGKPCKFCYKSNNGNGKNMSLETFKIIHSKFPKVLNQCAIGIGDINGNPDLFKIIDYCLNNDYNKIIPNITINGENLNYEIAKELSNKCGAISVSKYTPKDICYNAVDLLKSNGAKQVNIHQLVSKETLTDCYDLINDYKNDKRIKDVNCIVFMTLKPKGNRNNLNSVSFDDYYKLIKHAIIHNVPVGGDSCQANAMYEVLKDIGMSENAEMYVESCESFGIFSSYVNVDGVFFPCSFTEGEGEWKNGIDLLKINDFYDDLWHSDKLKKYRKMSIESKDKNNCRKCLTFGDLIK